MAIIINNTVKHYITTQERKINNREINNVSKHSGLKIKKKIIILKRNDEKESYYGRNQNKSRKNNNIIFQKRRKKTRKQIKHFSIENKGLSNSIFKEKRLSL